MGVQYLVREPISCRLLGRSQAKGKKKAFFIFYCDFQFWIINIYYVLMSLRVIWMCVCEREREMGEYNFLKLKKFNFKMRLNG